MDKVCENMENICSMSKAQPAFSSQVTQARYCRVRPVTGRVAGPGVTCAGDERCLPGFHVNRRDFGCWALEFVAEGEGTVTLNGTLTTLRPGHAFLYGPGVAHEIRTDPKRRMRKYFVDFFGRAAPAMLAKFDVRVAEVRRIGHPESVKFLFDALILEGQKGTDAAADAADAYLRLLLHAFGEASPSEAGGHSAAYLTWQRCQRVLDEQYRRLKGLRELSRATGVNSSHLCRLYQRFGRSSPHADLLRRKMNHAASLLVTTSRLVKDVANEVGFDDPLHFSRVFRKHFGSGPRSFKRAEGRPI